MEKGAARAQAKELRLCSKGRESQGRTSNRRAVGEDPSGLDCGEWCTEELGGEGQGAVGVAQVRNADLESGGGRGKGGVGWSRGKGGVGWEQGQRLAEGQEGPVGFWQGFPGEWWCHLRAGQAPRTGGTGLREERGVWFLMC